MIGVYKQIFKVADRIGPVEQIAIAGGAVVRFDRAEDIDVFVMDMDMEAAVSQCQMLLEKLAEEFAGNVELADQAVRASGYSKNRMLIGSVTDVLFKKPIQVIATTFPDAGSIIDSFDLSVHAWAVIRPHYLVGSLMKSTHMNEVIRVNRWDTPESTLTRLRKLEDRYGTQANAADVMKLEALIAQESR